MLNSKFCVRKYAVRLKEKIMINSYGETSGFTPVTSDEQFTVNGGFPFAIVLGMVGALVGAGIITYTIAQPKKSTK
jgi:hypothetical protein